MERRIDGHTKLYALIGSPVGHSGSPAMYNYSFEKLGINSAYLAFDVPLEKTKDALDAFRTFHAGGFNVTMPCKTAVAQLVDRLSPAAELVGACNTVVIEEDGTMTGHMTDGTGFVRNLLEHGVDIKGKKIVLLGTGGAATAIAVQAALDGAAEIAIFNRKDEFYANGEKTVEKIRKAVPSIGKVWIEDLDNEEMLTRVIGESDILVNATRAGMSPLENVMPVPEKVLRPDLAVADVVYNPKETLLVRKAKEAGCKAAVGGSGMLLWQGVAAFELFTGQEMPVEEVKRKILSVADEIIRKLSEKGYVPFSLSFLFCTYFCNYLITHEQIDDVKDSVFIVGAGYEVSGVLYCRLCVSHGYAQSGVFDHGYVIVAVSAADHFIRSHSETVEQLLEGSGFVDILGHDLKKEGLGSVNAQKAVICFFQVRHQRFQNFRLPGKEQLVYRRRQNGREIF